MNSVNKVRREIVFNDMVGEHKKMDMDEIRKGIHTLKSKASIILQHGDPPPIDCIDYQFRQSLAEYLISHKDEIPNRYTKEKSIHEFWMGETEEHLMEITVIDKDVLDFLIKHYCNSY